MAKLVISSITNVNFLNVNQATTLMRVLRIPLPLVKDLQRLHAYAKLIAGCPELTALTIDLKRNISDILFCFDTRDNFVCFHDDLNFSSHCFDTSFHSSLDMASFAQLSFNDKVKVIAQLSMADENGLLQLPWSFLCKQQLLSAADMFDIRLSTTQVQNCQNLTNALSAKIRRSGHYKNQYGRNTLFANIFFDFSLANLFICIGQGTDPSLEDNNIIGEFSMQSTKQSQQKLSLTRKYVAQPSTSIEFTFKAEKSGSKKVIKPQSKSSLQVNVASTLKSASLEQLRGIAAFYDIKLEIGRRATKSFMIDVIKESPWFMADLNTSLLSYDVIFCFDQVNKVLCTLQELTHHSSVSLPKSIASAYVSTLVPDLKIEDKAKILLQKTLSVTNLKSFSVPWCALTLSQKYAIMEDYIGDSPINLEPVSDLWNCINQSKSFKAKFGSHSKDVLVFIGSDKAPLDISINCIDPKVDLRDFSSHIFTSFLGNSAISANSHVSQKKAFSTPKEGLQSSEDTHDFTGVGISSFHNIMDSGLSKDLAQNNSVVTVIPIKPIIKLNRGNITPKPCLNVSNLPSSPGLPVQGFGYVGGTSHHTPLQQLISKSPSPVEGSLTDISSASHSESFDQSLGSDTDLDSDTHTAICKESGASLSKLELTSSIVEKQAIPLTPPKLSSLLPHANLMSNNSCCSGLQNNTASPVDSAGTKSPCISSACSELFISDSSEDESDAINNFSVDNDLTIQVLPRQKMHIKEHVCLTCKEFCKDESLKCFVCSRKVHYSCYKTQGKKALDHCSFTTSLNLANHKWFCNKCVNLSINDILELAAQKVKESIHGLEPSNDSNDLKVVNSSDKPKATAEKVVPRQNASPDYSFISDDSLDASSCAKLPDQHQLTPLIDLDALTDKIIQTVNQQIDKRMSNLQLQQAPLNSPSAPTLYSNVTQFDLPHRPRPISSVPTATAVTGISKNSLVNKNNSLVIHNVKERKFIKDSSSIKKEFNKHFQSCKIVAAFPTRSGALIIEMASRGEAEKVCQEWKPSHFSCQNIPNAATSCVILGDMKNLKVVIKNVPLHVSDIEVSSELSSTFDGATFKRFVNHNNEALMVGIATLSCRQHLELILEEDLYLSNSRLTVEEYIPKRRVIQCYNCKQFDHVQKWCPNSYSCTKCSKNHKDNDCQTPSTLRCTNCKKAHSSLDKNCPVYLNKLHINNALINQSLHD